MPSIEMILLIESGKATMQEKHVPHAYTWLSTVLAIG
jgi:hypothetical protein